MTEESKKTFEAKGACVCGSVTFVAAEAEKAVGACHCSICRRWCSGPFLAVNCGGDVSFSSEAHVGIFDSSAWAERGFCNQCGSALFYRLKQSGQYLMSAGTFTDQGTLTFTRQVFIDDRPAYYHFANETHEMTGAEVFAKYGA